MTYARRIGIVGGGQLARMLALAARPLGIDCVFVDPNPRAPAARVATPIVAAYDDTAALDRLVAETDVITWEFENVPLAGAEHLARVAHAAPPVDVLATAQDRVLEKTALRTFGLRTAEFLAVDDAASLGRAEQRFGSRWLLKTRRFGYDGKGQVRITSQDDLGSARDLVTSAPCIAEELVAFERELAMVVVRARDGGVAFYPPIETRHVTGVLRSASWPATDVDVSAWESLRSKLVAVLDAWRYVGVLTLELFETRQGLLANEIAPRVHNSAHLTIEAAVTSQFENHVRAIAGLPLGETACASAATMWNCLGAMPALDALLAVRGAHVHDYEKAAHPGRKVGHVTYLHTGDERVDATSLAALDALTRDAQ